ncbi:DUF5076 domain-containing protein [Granulicella sp. WH15]|uniref:DUF5076 domain-containing protein n=1 Tax=Granulicella sp. WH15 TaxID=2602070 RepID=UPI001366A5ED|nr:DUF5076 domain-containing protein [Granulicella sp. WH15]QHN05197.1 DUF5076 domain-containing protein [Granulicella sp. WH15]
MAIDNQLRIPDSAAGDKSSFELLRVWIADQTQQVSLRGGVWQDPAAWGVMLADLARNIVLIHQEQDEEMDADAFLATLLDGFDQEIDTVIDEFAGEAG